MVSTRSLVALLAALLTLLMLTAGAPQTPRAALRVRRQLADDDSLQPIEDADGDEQSREKRKLEAATQAKFGIKNAVLGFVFGSGITWRRPVRPVRSTQADTRSDTLWRDRSSDLTPLLNSGDSGVRGTRQADDIPVFDRNKVSLDFPGSLFGPSVSLLIRTTKIIGDVIQNSAVRYQTFLRLFRPLFRGQFEIKGLDPITTTTTTTTTSTATPSAADNEVRRRRLATH